MDRAEKQEELKELEGWFSSTKIAAAVEYRGLNVDQITKLRKQLRSGGALGKVTRNTLARISAKKGMSGVPAGEIDKFMALLDGPTMFVFSKTDPVTPAKVLAKFAKDNDKLKIKGALFDGAFIDPQGIEELSKLPSREELFAKLLSLMNAPATQLLRLMQAPGTQVVRVLNAHKDNLASKAQA